MSSNINRRSLAKGAAWAAPAILATATVPAYAASVNVCPEVKATSNIFTRGNFYEELSESSFLFGSYGKADVVFDISELPEGATITVHASGPIYPDPLWKMVEGSGGTSATLIDPANTPLTGLRVTYLSELGENGKPAGLKIVTSSSVQECNEFIPVNDPNQCATPNLNPTIDSQFETLQSEAKERGIIAPDPDDREKYEHEEVEVIGEDGTIEIQYVLTEAGQQKHAADWEKYLEDMSALSLELFGTEQPSNNSYVSIDVTDPGPYILITPEPQEEKENIVPVESVSDYIEGGNPDLYVYRVTPVDGKITLSYGFNPDFYSLYSVNSSCPLIAVAFWERSDSVLS